MRFGNQVVLRPRDKPFGSSGYGAITIKTSFSVLGIGSSSYASTNTSFTQDGRGTAITPNIRWETRSIQVVPPLTTQTFVISTANGYSGNGNFSAYDALRVVKDRIADNTFTENGPTVCEFGSVNLLTAYPNPSSRVDNVGIPGVPDVLRTFADTAASGTDWVKRTQEALDALGPDTRSIYFWIYPVFGMNDQRRWSQWIMAAKYYAQVRTHHKMRAFGNMYEGMLRSSLANYNQNDVNGLSVGYCTAGTKPIGDVTHSNSPTYGAIGEWDAKIKAAMNGGVPFVPTYPIYKYLAAATGDDELADLYWTSSDDMDDCTFTTNNADFTVTRVVRGGGDPNSPYRLVLKLVGAIPTSAPVWVNLTIAKDGVGSETYRLPISIDQRASGDYAPKPVLYRQASLWNCGYGEDRLQPVITTNSKTLTACFIMKMEEFDAQQIQFTETGSGNGYLNNNPAVGTSDTVAQALWIIDRGAAVIQLFIRKTAAKQINLVIYDTDLNTGTRVAVFNYTTAVAGGVWGKEFGWRMMSLHIDTANPAGCILYFSGGKRPGSTTYTSQTITLPAPPDVLMGLAIATSDQSANMRFFQEVVQMPSQFWTATRGRIWIDTGYVTPNSTNWDAMYDEAIQVAGGFPAKTLAGDGRTWGGITPLIDFKGSAASDVAGCDPVSYTDVQNGGKNTPNEGTGPGFMNAVMRPLVNA